MFFAVTRLNQEWLHRKKRKKNYPFPMKHVEAGVNLFHMNLGKIHVFYNIKFIMTIKISLKCYMPLYFVYKLLLYLLLQHKIS